MPTRRLRRPLRLIPRGTFQFTPKTVSLDVSAVLVDAPSGTMLHIGTSRGALEIGGNRSDARALNAAQTMSIVEALDRIRQQAGEPKIETLFDHRTWLVLRRTAQTIRDAGPLGIPFEGRSSRCYETRGPHPGESLWVETRTGEAIIETAVRTVDPKGRPLSVDRSYRPASPAEALRWLDDEGVRFVPAALAHRSKGGTPREIEQTPDLGSDNAPSKETPRGALLIRSASRRRDQPDDRTPDDTEPSGDRRSRPSAADSDRERR